MKVEFHQSGLKVHVSSFRTETKFDMLPPNLYTIKHSEVLGFYLEIVAEEVKLPDKLYGPVLSRAERIISTYDSREVSTGVLATGDRGSGKTLLALLVANKMLAKKLPVIQIQNAYDGGEFVDFVNKLGNCMLIFDEYSKMYGNKARRGEEEVPSTVSMLELLDGVKKEKRLVMVMDNSYYKLDEYFKNRPGRLFYHFSYTKLDALTIKDYCRVQEVPEDLVRQILDIRNSARMFSFDVLQAIVEEWKRYQLPLMEIVSTLNFEVFDLRTQKCKLVKIVKSGTKEPLKTKGEVEFSFRADNFYAMLRLVGKFSKGDDDEIDDYIEFYQQQIVVMDSKVIIADNKTYTAVFEIIDTALSSYSDLYSGWEKLR